MIARMTRRNVANAPPAAPRATQSVAFVATAKKATASATT